MSLSLKLSYSFLQAPKLHHEATPLRVGKGRALTASAAQVCTGELETGGQGEASSFSPDSDGQ